MRTTEAESSSNSLREKPVPLGYPVYTALPGLWQPVHFSATSPTAPVAAAVTIKQREIQQVRETEQILLQLHCFVWPAHVAVCSPATLKTPPGSPVNRLGNNVYLCERKATVNVYPRIERLLAAVGYKLPKPTVVCCEKLASPSRVRTEFGH